MTLTTSLRAKTAATRRFVTTSVVSERPLPYNLLAMDTPERGYDFWRTIITSEPDHEPDKENVIVVALNARLAPFAWHRVSVGTLDQSFAHPRETLRPIIASGAFAFAMMHNHPSGDPSPSQADTTITRRISEGAELLQIRFIDHIIIGTTAPGRTPYYSFREAGIIP